MPQKQKSTRRSKKLSKKPTRRSKNPAKNQQDVPKNPAKNPENVSQRVVLKNVRPKILSKLRKYLVLQLKIYIIIMNTQNSEGFVSIQNANNLDHITTNKKVKNQVLNVVYFIDYNKYLQQIEQDFSTTMLFGFKKVNKELIWNEFIKDIGRCDIRINNISIKDPNIMLQQLLKEYNEDVVYKTIMFSTPASMGFPCEILHKTYFEKKLFLSEVSNQKRYFKIHITTKKNSIEFGIHKNLRLINEKGKTKYFVYIKIEFDLLNDTQVFIDFRIKKSKLRVKSNESK